MSEMQLKLETWAEEKKIDLNQPHVVRNSYSRIVASNNRFYIFENIGPGNPNCVKVVDPCLRLLCEVKLYAFANENKPKHTRINYSIAASKGKVFIYGGLDVDTNAVVSTMECFDVTTYQFQTIKQRGDFKPAGRQNHAAIVIDMFTILVVGGTHESQSLFEPKQVAQDQLVMSFNQEGGNWLNRSNCKT